MTRAASRASRPVAGRCATPDAAPLTSVGVGMNDPEVIMLDPLPRHGLAVHRSALEAAGLAMQLVRKVPAPFRALADQVVRSAASVPANLAEAHAPSGRRPRVPVARRLRLCEGGRRASPTARARGRDRCPEGPGGSRPLRRGPCDDVAAAAPSDVTDVGRQRQRSAIGHQRPAISGRQSTAGAGSCAAAASSRTRNRARARSRVRARPRTVGRGIGRGRRRGIRHGLGHGYGYGRGRGRGQRR